MIVEYGKPIQKVAEEVQENVRKALEGLTGLHVVKVDVHVQGVSFEMEKKANENLLEATKKPVLTEAPEPEEPAAADAETDRNEDMPEDSEFDKETLDEEAKLDGAEPVNEEPDAEEKPAEETKTNDKNKKRPRMRIRS
ncbi:MAG: Asp23/Gls24 family envelope stress response protein, partial [Clostridia bacterium]|nr:Asp23/Gls24 family envelope stress response protein [Clostridia bacterium]